MKRSEVKKELTWDLRDLVTDEQDFYQKLDQSVAKAKAIHDKYKGQIKTLDDLNALTKDMNDYLVSLQKPMNFASLFYSEDGTNEKAMEYYNVLSQKEQLLQSYLTFVDEEVMNLDDAILKEAEETCKHATVYFRQIRKKKAHKPEYAVMEALAKLSPVLQAPYRIYEASKAADMRFGSFEVDGKELPMTFGLYEDRYENDSNTELRRKAYRVFHDKLEEYSYTLAENFNAEMKRQKALSEIHGYDSVFDYLLDEQEVSREIFEHHIDTLQKELPQHMRAYARKIKEKYQLDRLTYADLKIPLMPEFEKEITIEESKEYLRKGLAILGDEYVERTLRAIDERWIDFAENEGKSTGAFCASPYGVHPYVLISWTGKMNEVFVLAHELGHGGHFTMAYENNSILNGDVSLYLVECPSTTNEMLLANYLIESSDDPEMKRWVYTQLIERTYYHNFVTHGIEAIFQREVLRRIDRHESVNAPILNEIFLNILKDFWGDEVELTKGAELTWMRQPHYFVGLYSYTYQAGLSIGTEIFRRIQKGDKDIINTYKEVLSSGGLYEPEKWAVALGVQIDKGQALKNTIDFIGKIVASIE
ncbi:MAG: oligoendopeptidase F [Tissierellia bacterium]|nr:oligoendopeptidase F [Tissierellia bacterium]